MLTVAISKGRLFDPSLEMFSQLGYRVHAREAESRKLVVVDRRGMIRFIYVKPADVPVYVEYGVADLGIVGLDVLLEASPDVHQPLDLKFGRCKIVVAALEGSKQGGEQDRVSTLRVATKYPRLAAEYFTRHGVPVEIIVLSGSIELAPVLGLADCIVDLVQTGVTLRQNGLKIVHVIGESSARLIVNRASYQLRREPISELLEQIERLVARGTTP
ncbi:MAG: ATP phosphoribosyltransferase [Acidobacteriia bacterium]|nr:ATP phosphoribosyltransferase [Terriglobia bacterium]